MYSMYIGIIARDRNTVKGVGVSSYIHVQLNCNINNTVKICVLCSCSYNNKVTVLVVV